MLISSSSARRSSSSSSSRMPPKKKPEAAASKVASPSRTRASAERRSASARRKVTPPVQPAEKTVPGGADGPSHEHGGGSKEASLPRASFRPPPLPSGEKSVGNGAAKDQTARAAQPSKSKSSTHTPPDAQARHDTLVAAKALMQFPPSNIDPKVYQAWRARVEKLLDYVDGGPMPAAT